MKNNILKFIGFFIAVAFIASCDKEAFEEYSSVSVADAPGLTLTIDSNTDSAITVSYNMNMAGRVTLAVLPASVDTPAIADMQGRPTADYYYYKHDEGDAQGTITYEGLEPYTQYRVYGVGQNLDGVFSAIVSTEASRTDDFDAPTLDIEAGVSPAVSASPATSNDFEIMLSFNEPVVLASSVDMELGYYDPIADAIDWMPVVKDSISVSGNTVTIPQMKAELIDGEKVYLSIAEGSILDRNGNEYVGVESGIDTEGYPFGMYWRVDWEAKAELMVLPSDTVYVTDAPAFDVIKLVYPMDLSTASLEDYESSMIKVRYYTSELSQDYNISSSNVAIDGDTLMITLPETAEYGSNVTLSVAEGAVWDIYGNDVAAVEFGDYDWFISYGYTRDLIIGDYTIGSIVSHWDGPISDEYQVTISEDPDDDNNVIISGFMGSQDDIIAIFDGDLATFTIYTEDGMGQMLTFPAGNPYEAWEFEIWNGYAADGYSYGTISSDGTINQGGFGIYMYEIDGDGSNDGYLDLWPQSTWTKNPPKSTKSNINYPTPIVKGEGLGKKL